jgi:hypothetical protein
MTAAVPASTPAPPSPWIEDPDADATTLRKEVEHLKHELAAAQAGMSSATLSDKVIGILTRLEKMTKGEDLLEDLTVKRFLELEANEEAQKLLAAQKTVSGYRALEVTPLHTLLLEDDAPLEWRINGLMQIGHNVTLAARYKVGKTTLIANLLRSLVDGTNFLGEVPVKQVTSPVVVFNHELSDRQFTAWLRKVSIKNSQMIIPVNLRGKGLYLQDEDAQEWAIDLLKQYDAEVWIIDPLQAALRGTVNDDTVASEWIAAADRVKAEAGVSELLLVTHTGHLSKADEYGRSGNERSAGSSRWAGWPDALWTYTMDNAGTRFISAQGRDIDFDERGLDFDPRFNLLISQGARTGRVDSKQNLPYKLVSELFLSNPDKVFTRSQIESELRKNNKFITDGLREAKDTHMIEEVDLPRVPGKTGKNPTGYKLKPVSRSLYGVA